MEKTAFTRKAHQGQQRWANQCWPQLWVALKGTELARAQVATIRLKLHKIGALVLRLANAPGPWHTWNGEETQGIVCPSVPPLAWTR
jgi:hypothetical protein